MRLLPFAAFATLCVPSLAAHADTVYTYTGQYFYDVDGSYTTSDKVIGELTFSSPLPDNLVFYQAAIPEVYSLNNGVQTFTQANSILSFADVSTNGSGDITFYDYQFVLNSSTGSIKMWISSYADVVFDATSFALADPGSFSGPLTSTSVTPEPSSIALLGTGVLGIVGVVRKRFA